MIRKAERVRSAPKATGRINKRALFALEGDSEVAEELTRVARQWKSGGGLFSCEKNWRLLPSVLAHAERS
ncbi:hypothetical protein D8M03_03360 [Lysinibacillus endophyticus]|uniref:Uncharacterized protein n=1 Tax=Ureibacillus endophyticus TaxID=1978490 RepID=A0A494ZA09_9BACL|nr:hypothetical protein D8M03_03360 [Lysinibacillus endophyticus]